MNSTHKNNLLALFCICLLTGFEIVSAQITTVSVEKKLWSEKDRQYLLNELERTRDLVVSETENLSKEQWHFKPTETSWSIAQVLEHLGIYERLFLQEAWVAGNLPPEPQYDEGSNSDQSFLDWMAENNPHTAPENAVPLGFMNGKDNLTYFLYGRGLTINYISNTKKDLRVQFTPRPGEPNDRRSIHALYVVHFGHTDRHLRQIERIKSNPDFPNF